MTVDDMCTHYDWKECLKYASFSINDVETIVAYDNGENDMSNWVAVFQLKNGRFAFLSAGCDYTGWG